MEMDTTDIRAILRRGANDGVEWLVNGKPAKSVMIKGNNIALTVENLENESEVF